MKKSNTTELLLVKRHNVKVIEKVRGAYCGCIFPVRAFITSFGRISRMTARVCLKSTLKDLNLRWVAAFKCDSPHRRKFKQTGYHGLCANKQTTK